MMAAAAAGSSPTCGWVPGPSPGEADDSVDEVNAVSTRVDTNKGRATARRFT
jgi:hypothetical protein